MDGKKQKAIGIIAPALLLVFVIIFLKMALTEQSCIYEYMNTYKYINLYLHMITLMIIIVFIIVNWIKEMRLEKFVRIIVLGEIIGLILVGIIGIVHEEMTVLEMLSGLAFPSGWSINSFLVSRQIEWGNIWND